MTAYAHLLAEPLDELRALGERPLDRERARHTLHQASTLLAQGCVHDPRIAIAQLRALGERPPATQREFDDALLAAFAALGDRHTQAYLPDPLSSRVAFLPFLAGAVHEGRGTRYLLIASAHPDLGRGDELVSWDGLPIAAAIDARRAQQFGRTPSARRTQSVQMLTFRPLAWTPIPEPFVTVVVRGRRGRRIVRAAWEVATTDEMFQLAPFFGLGDGDDFFLDGFRADAVTTAHGTFARMRIASLHQHPNAIAAIYTDALQRLPQDGVILDMRRCERGIVSSAETLLQLFAKAPLAPLGFQFRLTPLIRDIVARSPGLEGWRDGVARAARDRRRYSDPQPLGAAPEPPAWRYPGPVVLITSGLTYSSAEMFAAGFQDHRLGTILGTAPSTGGGGASPWPQSTFHRLSGRADLAVRSDAATFRIAVRRAIRADGSGIERRGVRADVVHRPTARDLLDGDADLLEHATAILAEMNRSR